MASIARSAIVGAASGGSAQVLRLVLQLGSFVLLARLLSPDVYGLVAIVLAVTGIGEVLRDVGLSMAAIQAKDVSQQQMSNLFWVSLAFGLVVASVCLVASGAVADLFGRPEVAEMMRWLSLTFVFNSFSSMYRAHLLRDLQFVRLNAVEVVSITLGLSAGLCYATISPSYWALVLQQIVQAVTLTCLLALVADWRPQWFSRRAPLRGLLGFGIPYAATQVVVYVGNNVGSLVLGARFTAAELGLFNRAQQLVVLPLNQLGPAATQVALPVLARGSTDEADRSRRLSRGLALFCLPLAVILGTGAGVAEELIPTVLGPGWDGAAPLFAILACAGIFQLLGFGTFWWFTSTGRTGENLIFTIATRVFMLVLVGLGASLGPAQCAVAILISAAGVHLLGVSWVFLRDRSSAVELIRAAVLVGASALAALTSSVLISRTLGWPWYATAAISILIGFLVSTTSRLGRQSTQVVLRNIRSKA